MHEFRSWGSRRSPQLGDSSRPAVSGSLAEGCTENDDKGDAGKRAKGAGEDVPHGCAPCPSSNPFERHVREFIAHLLRRVPMLALALSRGERLLAPMLVKRRRDIICMPGHIRCHADGTPFS